MATMPDLTATGYYKIQYRYKVTDSVATGLNSLDLGTRGFRPTAWTDMHFKGGFTESPESDVAYPTGTGKLKSYPLQLKSQFWAEGTPDQFRDEIQDDLLENLRDAVSGDVDDTTTTYPDHQYLLFELWNGSTWSGYRLYCRLLGVSVTPVPKTQMQVASPVTLHFQVLDPVWYDNDIITKTINVTASAGTAVFTTNARSRVKRLIITVTKNGADHPTNVVVSNTASETANFNGTITTASNYWKLDCMAGKLWKGASYPETLQMDEFSGDFLGLDRYASETITVSSDGSMAYQVLVQYHRSWF